MGKTNLHCLYACLNGTQTCDCEPPFHCITISNEEKNSEGRKRWMENINRKIRKEKVWTPRNLIILELGTLLVHVTLIYYQVNTLFRENSRLDDICLFLLFSVAISGLHIIKYVSHKRDMSRFALKCENCDFCEKSQKSQNSERLEKPSPPKVLLILRFKRFLRKLRKRRKIAKIAEH